MKLKVKETFFDKREDTYVYPKTTPTIEREDARAKELVKAGVCEEFKEVAEPVEEPVEAPVEEKIPTAVERPSKSGALFNEKRYNLTISEAHKRATEKYDWASKVVEELGEEGEKYGLL